MYIFVISHLNINSLALILAQLDDRGIIGSLMIQNICDGNLRVPPNEMKWGLIQGLLVIIVP